MQRTFKVEACWDEDAKVWYSKSDIKGLNIEADTLDIFEEVLFDIAPELIVSNHIRPHHWSAMSFFILPMPYTASSFQVMAIIRNCVKYG